MARSLADQLGLPRLELDSVYHQPDWTPLPDGEFRDRVRAFAAGDRWVIDGNYTSQGISDIIWDRADTVVWMDPPKSVVMRRVMGRSISRAATGEELWNGNRERWKNLLKWDPEENIVRWSWTRFGSTRAKYAGRIVDPRWAHLEVCRLTSVREAQLFLDALDGVE